MLEEKLAALEEELAALKEKSPRPAREIATLEGRVATLEGCSQLQNVKNNSIFMQSKEPEFSIQITPYSTRLQNKAKRALPMLLGTLYGSKILDLSHSQLSESCSMGETW